MIKLYHASSVIERLSKEGMVFNGGVIHWYALDSRRDRSMMPRLIEGYEEMDALQRVYCEEFLDELLTEEEVDRLLTFLNRRRRQDLILKGHGPEILQTRQVELPIGGGQIGFKHRPVGGSTSRFDIPAKERKYLPFNVRGYVDISEEGNTARLRNTAQYVRRVLQVLGVDAGIKLNQIEEAVQAYYDKEGLYITAVTKDNILERIEIPLDEL